MSISSVGKHMTTSFLKAAGLYERIRGSAAYDMYWRVADASVVDKRDHEVGFYRGVLRGLTPGALVFDIGANQGYKTDMFLRLGARVVAVDPDPTNVRRLTERFLRWRLRPMNVRIVQKAVSESTGSMTMWVDAPGSAKNTLNPKWVDTLRVDDRFGAPLEFARTEQVETTTIDDLAQTYGDPFYIKIDVEGYESTVLRGMHRPPRYLSFEVNLPEFREEGLECVDRVQQLHPTGEFAYAADAGGAPRLHDWMPHDAFRRKLSGLTEPSIEVFWRSNVGS
jgi:FkbM family methyltransferase